jgi:hypothetical protein
VVRWNPVKNDDSTRTTSCFNGRHSISGTDRVLLARQSIGRLDMLHWPEVLRTHLSEEDPMSHLFGSLNLEFMSGAANCQCLRKHIQSGTKVRIQLQRS